MAKNPLHNLQLMALLNEFCCTGVTKLMDRVPRLTVHIDETSFCAEKLPLVIEHTIGDACLAIRTKEWFIPYTSGMSTHP
ncbi:hypothetical protein SE18_11415 [Herpetosiphon geysericola]|uniref:Uncharacterized protein n=1 Tax=Herpetosiphon geysericola TaxID=70996 RepID=A0A0P6YNX2_9CHLR|nr:hypothetical protein SE18_11415 [Herpetosiphon geysericola]